IGATIGHELLLLGITRMLVVSNPADRYAAGVTNVGVRIYAVRVARKRVTGCIKKDGLEKVGAVEILQLLAVRLDVRGNLHARNKTQWRPRVQITDHAAQAARAVVPELEIVDGKADAGAHLIGHHVIDRKSVV